MTKTTITSVILVCVTYLLVCTIKTEALQCLSCDRVAEARDCSHLQICGANQECFVQRFIASNLKQYYKMGCMDTRVCSTDSNSLLGAPIGKKRDQTDITSHWLSNQTEITSRWNNHQTEVTSLKHNRRSEEDLLLCLQCCNNVDGCNKDLCGSAPTTSLRCLKCDDVLSWKDCQEIEECSQDELCYTQSTAMSITYSFRVKMGCLGQAQCDGIRKAFPERCVVCCDDADFCNYNACDNYTNARTTTTTTTTPKPTTITIDGPSSAVTWGNTTTMTCLTLPPATNYSWSYQNGAALPDGIGLPYQTITNGGFAGVSVLTIPAVNENNTGNYSCMAYYPDGRKSVSVPFELKVAPLKPFVDIKKSAVVNNFVLICNVTGYPDPVVSWNFDGVELSSVLSSGYDTSRSGTEYTLFVYSYDPKTHDGVWTCSATNAGGKTSADVNIP